MRKDSKKMIAFNSCPACGYTRVNHLSLRLARKRARISLRQMADRLGFTVPYLRDVELGNRNCTEKIKEAYQKL